MKMKVEDVNTPLVSVILPFYNASQTLKRAIDSILNQTYQQFELILIDNSSSDSSYEIAESYQNNDERISLIKEPRRGVVFASNAGIRIAKGQFIARMDADDFSYPNRLEDQIKEFEKDTSTGVVSGLVDYQGEEMNEGFITYVNWLNTIKSDIEINLNQFVEFPLANPSTMFRKSLFDQYGLYIEGEFPEDYELFLRLKSKGVKMVKSNKKVLLWNDLHTRLTRNDSRYSQEAFFQIKAKYLSLWLEKNNPDYPNVYIWGAGRLSRRRSDLLKNCGIKIINYIDVKESSTSIHYEAIPPPKDAFIVSYVANRGARDEIREFLNSRSYREGQNYIIAS